MCYTYSVMTAQATQPHEATPPGQVRPRTIKFPKGPIGPQLTNKVLPWFETFWHTHKRFPQTSEIRTHFGFSENEVLLLLSSKFFLRCLSARGISPTVTQMGQGQLDSRQLAAIAIITNFSDLRPATFRLEEAGITTEELQGWYSNKTFNEVLAARSEATFANFAPSATAQLGRQIERGNLNAIKFYYEITGRANSPEAINVKRAMQVLIEAVQKHVKDPEVLEAIAREVQAVRALE